MDKQFVAEVLEKISLMLNLKGDAPFQARAYALAARTIASMDQDLQMVVAQNRLQEFKGIGGSLEDKITTLVTTGKLDYYHELRGDIPDGVFDMLKIPKLGPHKVKILYRDMGIESLEALEKACRQNKLIGIHGFGRKTQANVMDGIAFVRRQSGRFPYGGIIDAACAIREQLSALQHVSRVAVAGSLRRHMELVGNMDLVAASTRPESVTAALAGMDDVTSVIAKGRTRTRAHLACGIQADLRVASEREFPCVLRHVTGSRKHNARLHALARDRGFAMNAYGLFDEKKRPHACKHETDIFHALGLAYIPPELREGAGEIEAAAGHELPTLLTREDIRGVLHNHSTWSDGRASIRDMATAAKRLGFTFYGTGDHSRTAAYAGGLAVQDVKAQGREIEELRDSLQGIHVFWGIESDILRDGSLDYEEDLLHDFDYVVGSVHSTFGLSEVEMTDRVIRAMENPYTTILAHPTGRLLGSRDAYAVDMHAVMDAAADLGVMIEINANPRRLDLDWRYHRYAVAKGVMLVINPDAHRPESLTDTFYGVGIARKGWLTRKDVLNSWTSARIEKLFSVPRHQRKAMFVR